MRKVIIYLLVLGGALGLEISSADVDVDVNIRLPVLAVGSDPMMAVIPGTYVYFVVDQEVDLFFYQGYWWRLHGNRWYRAAAPGGPWRFFKTVPPPLLKLPPGWRRLPPGHAKFKFAELKKNWKRWEKEKRWDKKDTPVPKPDVAPQEKADKKKDKTSPKGRGARGR